LLASADVDLLRLPAERTRYGVGEIASDLRHPCTVRPRSDAGDVNAARLEVDDEQHEIAHEPPMVSTSLKKSAAAMAPQCAFRNVFRGTDFPRVGAGSMPRSLRTR
jgi:hypothetical protein